MGFTQRFDINGKDEKLFFTLKSFSLSFKGANDDWRRHKYVENFEEAIKRYDFDIRNSVNQLYEEGFLLTQVGEFELANIDRLELYPTIKSYVDKFLNEYIPYIEKHTINKITKVEDNKEKMLSAGYGIPYQVTSMLNDAKNYVKKIIEIKIILITITNTESYDYSISQKNNTQLETSVILNSMYNIASGFTRHPQHFSEQNEESLRLNIVSGLNGLPGIDASAETLNRAGKTDIRILDINTKQTRLIVECKMWYGPSDVNKAINQLLGYITTNDTNACLIFFVKNKQFTDIINAVVDIIPEHENHIQTFPNVQSGWQKHRFSKIDDRLSYFNFDVMLFHIPKIK
jgi:hypothetical protein